jgi:hypothetical protein
MGDMGELFNAQRKATKQHRADMLAKADTTGWTRHTEWHYSRLHGPVRDAECVDWWPSGGKAKYKGRMVYGHRQVIALIARLFPKEPQA